MSIDRFVYYVAQAIHCLTRLYEKLLPETETVELRLRVLGSENRKLVTYDSRRLYYPYICKIPDLIQSRAMTLAEWRAGVIDHADELVRDVFHRFNWEQPGSFKQSIEQMFLRRF